MPTVPRTRPRARRTSRPRDAESRAVAELKHIERMAHRKLDRELGPDQAGSIALDVWMWLTKRRIKDPTFLDTTEKFKPGILRKLKDEVRKVRRDLKRWDDSTDVDQIAERGSAHAAPKLNAPDQIFAQSETQWHVQRAIRQLPPQMQRVIRLYDLQEWSADDVAAELGIAPGTVRQIRNRAKARLHELLESFGGLMAA